MRSNTHVALVLAAILAITPNYAVAASDTVSVSVFGAVGNGQADDAPAIQKALDSGAATVVIPKGTYRIGSTLRVGSGTTVTADPEAVIRLADGVAQTCYDFIITNKHPGNGDADIRVQGGIWDANNEHNARGKDGDFFGYTGTAINFVNVKQLTLRDLTVRNPDAFSIRLGEVEDFLVENIVLDQTVHRPNQDGVHVGGYSQRGVIRKIRALHPNTPNDDMVALNADDDVERVLNLGMRRGPIRNVLVEHIRAEGAYTFVRLLSREARVENIVVRDVKGTCRHYALNLNRWRFPAGSGDIRNVLVEDFEVGKSPGSNPDHHLIHMTLLARDLHITNFRRLAEPEPTASRTLHIDNGRENTLQEGDGDPKTVTAFAQDAGDVVDLFSTRAQSASAVAPVPSNSRNSAFNGFGDLGPPERSSSAEQFSYGSDFNAQINHASEVGLGNMGTPRSKDSSLKPCIAAFHLSCQLPAGVERRSSVSRK